MFFPACLFPSGNNVGQGHSADVCQGIPSAPHRVDAGADTDDAVFCVGRRVLQAVRE